MIFKKYDPLLSSDGLVYDANDVIVRTTEPGSLITDRTQADVDRVKKLTAKGWANFTDEEKAEWEGEMKGAYNASDLNRVESAVDQLLARMREIAGSLESYAEQIGVAWETMFAPPYDMADYALTVKLDWTEEDRPRPPDMTRYLGNVVKLRNAVEYATTALPSVMDKLTFEGANAIEQALERLDAALDALEANKRKYILNTSLAWVFSGDVYCGEV